VLGSGGQFCFGQVFFTSILQAVVTN